MSNSLQWRVDLDGNEVEKHAGAVLIILKLRQSDLDGESAMDDLSVDEIDRATRFVQNADRNRFVAGRMLIRQMLGYRLGVEPAKVPLVLDRGRPDVGLSFANAVKIPSFNLSHSGDFVLLAWSDSMSIGVDVEACATFADMQAVAKRVMTKNEFASFNNLAAADRSCAFFHLWVRKEAILKNMQTGFSVEPARVSVGVPMPVVHRFDPHGEQCATGHFEDREFNMSVGSLEDDNAGAIWALATSAPLSKSTLEVRFVTVS